MIRALLRNAGIHPRRFVSSLRGWLRYLSTRREFRNQSENTAWPWAGELPMLTEWNEESGSVGAYFLQDQLVARWIHEAKPQRHVDVGSRLDGFIGSLSVFRDVDVIDIRPQMANLTNIRFHQLDIMRELPPHWLACTDSLSCLHTIEHFGLGRYDDEIDAHGHLKGLAHLKQMVKTGGILYLSTPIGPQRVVFNAHRVTSISTMLGWFSDGWSIQKFAVIDDKNTLHENVDPQQAILENFGCHLGVGIIAATKLH